MSTALEIYRPEGRVEEGAAREFVTMTIASQLFGIPVLQVQDVLGPQRITRIPLAPSWVAGALNLRGRIVTAIDVRRRLGLPSADHVGTEMSIVIEQNGELYSLIVDEVGEVMSFPASVIAPNPPTLDLVWREVSTGIIRLENRLLVILDVKKLFDLAQNDPA
jgi:purine-binding chemotaxis protein CheW